MRKIVVVDGYTLNPGDLCWDGLAPFGDVTVYDQTTPELVLQRCEGAEIVFTNKVLFPKEVLRQLKSSLRYIGLLSTGVNVVDLAAANDYGITVTNIPAYSTDSVAQLTFAHLLNLTFRLSPFVHSVREGVWGQSLDFCYWLGPMTELAGLTFGSVGYGNIGRKVCEIARSFGMKTLACNSRNEKRDNPALTLGALVDLDTLLRESDVVSLHCPLTETNRGMIHAATIAKMKHTAFFLNTSRGLLVDETALADALNTDRIAGAGLDVLDSEPPRNGSPLITAKNCFITPHIAWGTTAARLRLLNIAVENLAAFLDGRSQNVVSGWPPTAVDACCQSSPRCSTVVSTTESSAGKWYQDGLYFECQQCGRCCSGGPGYVWVTDEEIAAIATALGENKDRFEAVYVQTIGNRKSLREFADYSCVLLHPENRQCILYDRRPVQCRTWPFWDQNLATPNDWKKTAKRCPGCNCGTFHSIDAIEQQRLKTATMLFTTNESASET